MAEPINLNQTRKLKAQGDARAQAAENRVKFGRSKSVTSASKAEAERAWKALTDKKLED